MVPAVDIGHRGPNDLNGCCCLAEAWIEGQMAVQELPGLSVAVVDDQDLVWARGFGFEDLETRARATPDTIYRIASISKTFTSTAVLQLRDRGLLHLDDPVAHHLPWFEVGGSHGTTIESFEAKLYRERDFWPLHTFEGPGSRPAKLSGRRGSRAKVTR